MSCLILVTGGCRSGKSTYAQTFAEKLPGRKLFLATCPVTDDEMLDRIQLHQQSRAAAGWDTLEEPLHLAQAIAQAHAYPVILVDCLTLWVNNLMYEAEQTQQPVSEQTVVDLCRQILEQCQKHPGTILFVTNEVGMGIVPDNAAARLFRDLIGRCNQTMAAGADTVVLMTSGIPLTLKG